jgi:hypothetical protein
MDVRYITTHLHEFGIIKSMSDPNRISPLSPSEDGDSFHVPHQRVPGEVIEDEPMVAPPEGGGDQQGIKPEVWDGARVKPLGLAALRTLEGADLYEKDKAA